MGSKGRSAGPFNTLSTHDRTGVLRTEKNPPNINHVKSGRNAKMEIMLINLFFFGAELKLFLTI